MVHITPETAENFKRMFKREYGVEYSDQEAWEATHNLVGFFGLLLKVDRRENPENYIVEESSEERGGVNNTIEIAHEK